MLKDHWLASQSTGLKRNIPYLINVYITGMKLITLLMALSAMELKLGPIDQRSKASYTTSNEGRYQPIYLKLRLNASGPWSLCTLSSAVFSMYKLTSGIDCRYRWCTYLINYSYLEHRQNPNSLIWTPSQVFKCLFVRYGEKWCRQGTMYVCLTHSFVLIF